MYILSYRLHLTRWHGISSLLLSFGQLPLYRARWPALDAVAACNLLLAHGDVVEYLAGGMIMVGLLLDRARQALCLGTRMGSVVGAFFICAYENSLRYAGWSALGWLIAVDDGFFACRDGADDLRGEWLAKVRLGDGGRASFDGLIAVGERFLRRGYFPDERSVDLDGEEGRGGEGAGGAERG